MDQKDLDQVRKIAESMIPGVSFSLHELRVVFELLADVETDEIIRASGGREEHCGCKGEHCPGVVVVNEDGQILMIPTFAAIANLREISPVEYIDGEIERHRQATERAIKIYRLVEDANDDDVLEEISRMEDDENPTVRAILAKIRREMFRQELASGLQEIALRISGQFDTTVH